MLICGAVTVKLLELFTVSPLTRTLIGPLVAPVGTFDLNAGAGVAKMRPGCR